MMRFYTREISQPLSYNQPRLPGVSLVVWHPKGLRLLPPALPLLPYAVWAVLHALRIFSNREYGAVLFFDGSRLVHHSIITPRFFRFPDMGAGDIQIGGTYTHREYRGRGFAKAAIHIACGHWAGKAQRVWYVVDEENQPSIRTVESCGFRLIGRGNRVSRFGIRVLGRYEITSEVTPNIPR